MARPCSNTKREPVPGRGWLFFFRWEKAPGRSLSPAQKLWRRYGQALF